MNILDSAREIAQDISRDLQLEDDKAEGWNRIFKTLGMDPETGRTMLGL